MAAKTVDAMVNVEPYNAIAEAEGLANTLVDFYSFDKLPVFMAATPEFVDKNPGHRGRLSQGLARRRQGLQEQSGQGRRTRSTRSTPPRATRCRKETFAKALSRVEVNPGWPADLEPYMTHHAEVLMAANKIKAVPDWNKAFRKDFLKKAMA